MKMLLNRAKPCGMVHLLDNPATLQLMETTMQSRIKIAFLASTAAIFGACAPMSPMSQSATSPMSFFVTSANPGKGGDLGGLAGADAYCERLATSANAGG